MKFVNSTLIILTLLLCVVPAAMSPANAAELINVVQWSESEGGNGHVYGVMPVEVNWLQARDSAMSFVVMDDTGYLATVTSAAENIFIRDNVIHDIENTSIIDGLWVGGFDADYDDWVWITGETWAYTNWASGEPNNLGLELGVLMWGPDAGGHGDPGEWNDSPTVHEFLLYWAVIEFAGGETLTDLDLDGIPDSIDNCLGVSNYDQVDSDADEHGDACDNCPDSYNPDQGDVDIDGVGDSCDNCLVAFNPDQEDMDDDGIGDSCDTCTDIDGDGYGNPGFPANTCVVDNCPRHYNPDQADTDQDGVGDICQVAYDTIYCDDGSKANALGLVVGNNGNIGNLGEGKVNLDYWVGGVECAVWNEDTEDNPYLGDSRVYLYDGSPVICWDDGGEILCDYSMYGRTGGSGGFYPSEDPVQDYPAWMNPQDTPDCDFIVREFVTRDTAILIEQVTIAPNIPEPQFMLQATRFSNLTAAPITGLAIGEAIDWNIPSDSGNWNKDGWDGPTNMMYQIGEEYSQDTIECTRNNERFGGIAVLGIYEDGVDSASWPAAMQYGIFVMDNATQVDPLGHFSPDLLFDHMNFMSGFTQADSADKNDLHMVATFRANHTLAVGRNLIVYTLLATQFSGSVGDFETTVGDGIAYYDTHFSPYEPPTCCVYVGDINHDGASGGFPDISDLIYLVTYMFSCGPFQLMCNDFPFGDDCCGGDPCIFPEADVNCDGSIQPDIGDLIYLVTYMFLGGPPPTCWDQVDPEDPNTWLPACNRP